MTFDVVSTRRGFPGLMQTARGGVALHYLDNAATTQMVQEAIDAYVHHEITSRANVQRGSHYLAERSTEAYESARSMVCQFLHASSPKEVIFTSGTTESINLLASSFGSLLRVGDEIVVSEAEHHSNFLPWQRLCDATGVILKILPVTKEGRLDIDALPHYVSKRCRLIALTHCSNVTGHITDVLSVVKVADSVGAKVFLDGAQMVQHGPVDVQELGVDFYAFSGHKCFGPTGIGVLWGPEEQLQKLPPFQTGGGMVNYVDVDSVRFADYSRRFEAGTPPIAQAIALASALQWMMTLDWDAVLQHEQRLFKRAINGVNSIPGIHLLGEPNQEHRQSLISFANDSIHPHDICHVLDESGVALRGGHHCAQILLRKMGVTTSARFSIALYNNDADIDALINGLERAVEMLS